MTKHSIPACKECKHMLYAGSPLCRHPINMSETLVEADVYNGIPESTKKELASVMVFEMREGLRHKGRVLIKGKCGIEGKLFEPQKADKED